MSDQTINIKRRTGGPVPRARVVSNGEPIPKVPLYLAGGVVLLSLVIVFFSTWYGVESWKLDTGAVVKSRDLVFDLRDDETIRVTEAGSGALVELIPPHKDGFLHGALRAIKRERLVQKVAQDAPLRIILSEDGSHTLIDTVTNRSFYLRAFGKDNLAAVARFLDQPTVGAAATQTGGSGT